MDRLTYIWRYSSLDTSEYVGRVKYIAYDKAGRLTDMKYDGGGITTIGYDVRYNEHLLAYATITTASAVTIDFGYDTVDQVNSLDYTGTGMPADVNYSYDDAGNRTNKGYSTGAMNVVDRAGFNGASGSWHKNTLSFAPDVVNIRDAPFLPLPRTADHGHALSRRSVCRESNGSGWRPRVRRKAAESRWLLVVSAGELRQRLLPFRFT